jgi:hypothetical protein
MVRSDKTVVVLIGPKGEGKTYGAIGAILHHATRFPYKIRGAVIRDRFTNIQRHTIPSIMKAVGDVVTFHRDGALMKGPNFEADLFGVDDLADLSNLQGSEYYFVWIEEPAPVFEVGSAGLREDVFDICYARGGREEGAIDRVFVTMNPASKAHWTYKRFVLKPETDFEVIRIPYGENPHLPSKEREKTKRAYINRPEMYMRYVSGEFSSVNLGEAVVPEFSELRNRSYYPLVPFETLTFRLWDGWMNPTCVFVQITPRGQIEILATLCGENIGVKQLINDSVKPLIATKFYKIKEWRDIGDLHLRDKDQSDSTKSAAEIIENEFHTYFEDGEMSWERRRETLKEGFNMTVDGDPKIVVSCDDDVMLEALGGGWHYHKNSSGLVLTDKPVKDKYSHPGDALSHGLAAILHPGESASKPRVEKYETLYDPFVEDRPRLYAPEPKLTEWNPFDEERVR